MARCVVNIAQSHDRERVSRVVQYRLEGAIGNVEIGVAVED